jgi:hypothetical protein
VDQSTDFPSIPYLYPALGIECGKQGSIYFRIEKLKAGLSIFIPASHLLKL